MIGRYRCCCHKLGPSGSTARTLFEFAAAFPDEESCRRYLAQVRWPRGWLVVDGRPEPLYVIKYAESEDGIEWWRGNRTSIEPSHPEEANARPWVVRGRGGYRMWFCHQRSRGYRSDPRASYRIGYAESVDGEAWVRKDDEAGIDVSDSGWVSVMVTYPSVYEYRGALHLLYNGNGFGASGIGHAVAEG
jgi:hypothetical protein